MGQLQSHICQTASSLWGNICAFPHILGNPSSYMTSTASFWISLCMRKIWFSFLSLYSSLFTSLFPSPKAGPSPVCKVPVHHLLPPPLSPLLAILVDRQWFEEIAPPHPLPSPFPSLPFSPPFDIARYRRQWKSPTGKLIYCIGYYFCWLKS